MIVLGGSTDVTTYFSFRLAADGTDATGLTITNMDLQYVRTGANPVAKVDAVALAATDTAHTDNRAIEVDGTDQPGLYRVDWPDAAFAAGVREVILTVKCATVFTEHKSVQIDPLVVANSVTTGAITAAAIANGAIDAATFAAGAIDAAALAADAGTEIGTAVWATTARVLTAATNLTALASQTSVDDLPTNAELATALGTADDAVLAQIALVKGQTDLIPSDPADASVIAGRFDTLDTSVADLPTNAELATSQAAADDATLAAIAALTVPTAIQNADALLDRANAIETGVTPRGALRLASAMLGGKVSGAGTGTETFRNAVADSKDRLVITDDVSGNRTAITTDLT